MNPNLLIDPTQEGLVYASNLILAGELVAFPTETVYGLGANALDETAVLKVFAAKGRPTTDPLIVHISEINEATDLIEDDDISTKLFYLFAEKFWPGPLTIIVRASRRIPSAVTAGTGYVGIRSPNHPLASKFIRACGVPIAAPSANRFGHVSPTLASHVLDDLGSKGVRVLNGDVSDRVFACEHGIESTVIKFNIEDKTVIILRQGAITQKDIEEFLQNEIESSPFTSWSVIALHRVVKMHNTLDENTQDQGQCKGTNTAAHGQVAPGQALTHYAPDVPCYALFSIVSPTLGFKANIDLEYESKFSKKTISLCTIDGQIGGAVVVIDFHQQLRHLSNAVAAYRDLSPSGNSAEAARHLFASLRWAEMVPNASLVLLAPIMITRLMKNSHALTDDTSDNLIEGKDAQIYGKVDILPGLADRAFRATSGTSVEIVLNP